MNGIPQRVAKQFGGVRKFREAKRAALHAAFLAIGDFRVGCAFTPAYGDVDRLESILRKMMTACSVKEWGR